jgi:hypothetical protein
MRGTARALTLAALAALALLAGAGPALADPADDCQLWRGSEHCREVLTKQHIPTRGELRPAPARKCPAKRQPCGFIDRRGVSWA